MSLRSKRTKQLIVLAASLAVAFVTTAKADIIYDNGAPDLVNAYRSDFDTSTSADTVQVADDFVFGVDSIVKDVHWWGAYGFDNIPPATDDFTIRLFDMPADVPDMVPFFEINVGAVDRFDTGDDIVQFDVYEYRVEIPDIPLTTGQYLLSIVNDTTGTESDWFWATSSQSGNDWERDGDRFDWVPHLSTVELAFNLTGVPACPWDLNNDGSVGVPDLLILLAFWGPCPPVCLGDFDGDHEVGVSDLLVMLANWGPCP